MRHARPKSAVFFLAIAASWLPAIFAAPNPDQVVPDRLDLKGALGFALENNFDIRQAQERIRQQEGLLVEIRANNLPNLGLTYSYSKEDRSLLIPFVQPSDQTWTIELQVKQNIFSGNSVKTAISAQKYRREAAVLELRSVIDQVLLNVRDQFYAVLLAQKKITVAEQSLNLLEQQVKTVQDRFSAGAISRFDLLQAQVAVANGRPPLIRARNDFRIAVEQLRQLLGFTTTSPGKEKKIPEILGELVYEPIEIDLIEALRSARANRPELQQLSKLEEAASESVSSQKGGYWPTLAASAGYEITKDPSTNDLDKTQKGWVVGVQGSWTVFDLGTIRGRVAQARSLLAQANLTTTSRQLAIDVEVRQAHSTLQEAVELVVASRAVVGQAEESVRLAQARFAAGTATQLDVLQSQVALTEARTNEIEAYYNHSVAVAQLRKAMAIGDNYAPTR